MQEEQMEKETISAKALLLVLAKRWWVILLAGILVAGVLVACTALLVEDRYSASTLLYVNNESHGLSTGKISAQDLDAAKNLVPTCCVFVKTRKTLDKVLEKEQLSYSYEQLKSMVKAEGVDSTQIFRVTVTSLSADEAKVLANTIAGVLETEIPKTIDGASVKIVEDAVRPGAPISRGYAKKGILGFVVGVVLAAGAVLLVDGYIRDSVKSKDWLEEYYGESVPVLATIPDTTATTGTKYGYYSCCDHRSAGEDARKGDEQ